MPVSLTELYEARIASGGLQDDPAQRAVLPALERLRDWLQANPIRRSGLFAGLFAKAPPAPPRGLYLWGPVGRGKSMLMDLLVGATDIAAKRRIHFHAFMQEVQHRLDEVRRTGVEDAVLPVADALSRDLRLLALDEMQITDIADAMIVGRLFERLFASGVIVVTTSNRPPGDLYKDGLNRQLFLPFIEMLCDRLELCELAGPEDYRQHMLAGAQVYFHPAGGAGAALDAIWAQLAGGAAGTPLRLTVNGRETVLPRFANGVGRAGFWDLCGQPLGPADYLAIAGAVRVLIIDEIPLLSSSNYNQAIRFVTLIDALYEARVRLVCSAADEPERLYVEGEGAFEFARTASRLREMQAAGWGRG